MRRGGAAVRGAAAALTIVVLAGCGGSGDSERRGAAAPGTSTAPTTAPVAASTTSTEPPVPTTAPVTFRSAVTPVSTADLGPTWREGCPVGPDQLRRVELAHRDFAGGVQTGALIVHVDVVDAVQAIFRRLFDAGIPIRRMEPIDRYGGDDDASMAADNTSAFNCRLAVTSGPAQWSGHAYGRAIDVNPVENPYVLRGASLPPEGAAYLDRADVRPGMAVAGGPLVDAFAAEGWHWGGRWAGAPDYQHFSPDGA